MENGCDVHSITPLLHYSMCRSRSSLLPSSPPISPTSQTRSQRVEAAGADWLHLDIMDGHFVDNISFGPAVVGDGSKTNELPLDVHLMIEHADHYVPRFVEAGREFHHRPRGTGSETRCRENAAAIRDAGCRAGLTLNPATPFDAVEPYLADRSICSYHDRPPGFRRPGVSRRR